MNEQIKDIAQQALRLKPESRASFIEESCSGDTLLLEQVQRLITVMSGATIAPTEQDTAPRQFAAPASEHSQRWVGRFRIIERLGSGAMGVVYLAEQQEPRREIALKVIRPESMSVSRRQRFVEETQVLARLVHPGIAAIYQSGAARVDGEDCPYFAMELVRGMPIDEHARTLTIDRRVGLMIDVCRAVEHAHQRGVIHRDLKPANILVDGEGRAKILDFGVARTLDGSSNTGEVVGTIPYMAHEQLLGSADTDTRADVHALGIILCELLTGSRPRDLEGLTVDEACEAIATTPAKQLRELDASLDSELETIVARAIAIDPDDRYASAYALSEDLRRYLRKEPLEARIWTRRYVTKMFVKRNAGLVSALSLAGVLLVGGVMGVAWQAVEATRGWRIAREEAQKSTAVTTFLTTMLSSADPEIAIGEELTVRELLDASARDIDAGLTETPGVSAAVRGVLASTYRSLGLLEESEHHAREALTASRELIGPDAPATIEAMQNLASTLIERGEYEEADALGREARDLLAQTLGEDDLAVVWADSQLARVRYESGDQVEALKQWGDSLERGSALVDRTDAELMKVRHNYASALAATGELSRAEEIFREVYQDRIKVFGEAHPQTVGALSMLAAIVQRQERKDEALELFRKVLDARIQLFGEDHPSTLTAMGNLAVVYVDLGRPQEAADLTRRVLIGYRASLGEGHAKTLTMMGNLAYMLEDLGQIEEAATLYREQIELLERSSGGTSPETWSSYNNLAMLLQGAGKPEEARPLYEKLLAMCDAALPADHYVTAIFRNNYGECLGMLGEYDAALAALQASDRVLQSVFEEGSPRLIKSRQRIAAVQQRITGGGGID